MFKRLHLTILFFALYSCGSPEMTIDESQYREKGTSQALESRYGLGALGGNVGAEIGLKFLSFEVRGMATAGVAKKGWLEILTGTKPTLGGYVMFGPALGLIAKADLKFGLATITVPDGTISGTYCGPEIGGSAAVAGLEYASLFRRDGGQIKLYTGSVGPSFPVHLVGQCLFVVGVRI